MVSFNLPAIYCATAHKHQSVRQASNFVSTSLSFLNAVTKKSQPETRQHMREIGPKRRHGNGLTLGIVMREHGLFGGAALQGCGATPQTVKLFGVLKQAR
jgi:hypothetical protein